MALDVPEPASTATFGIDIVGIGSLPTASGHDARSETPTQANEHRSRFRLMTLTCRQEHVRSPTRNRWMNVADAPLPPTQSVGSSERLHDLSANGKRARSASQLHVAKQLLQRGADPATLEVRPMVG